MPTKTSLNAHQTSLANLSRSGRKPGSRNRQTLAALAHGVEAAREYAAGALATLHSVASDADAPAAERVQAARALLDRAYGAPVRCEAVELRAVAHSVTPEAYIVAGGDGERRRECARQREADPLAALAGLDAGHEREKRELAEEAEARGREKEAAELDGAAALALAD